jgi:hypothetical protein
MDIQTEQGALVLLRVTTTKRLAEDLHNGTQAGQIEVKRTFTDDDPDGYGRTEGRYLHLCVVIASDVRTATGRDFYFGSDFMTDHQSAKISKFISDAADLLMNSKPGNHAAEVAWAQNIIASRS